MLPVPQQAVEEPGPVLSTAAALLDQRARRQERRTASPRASQRRRRIDVLSAAAGAIAMVRTGFAAVPPADLLSMCHHDRIRRRCEAVQAVKPAYHWVLQAV